MSEVARINLSGPGYDPRQNRSREAPMSERIRQGRQDALQNALGMYKVKAAKYQMEQAEAIQKSDEFLAKNASNLFSRKASALDPASWKFTKPGAREDFFKQWKKEVGGNYQGFMKAYDAAKGAEQQGMLQNLMMDRKKYRTEIEYKRAFSESLNALSDADRNQLLSQASPEVYSRISELYITPDESDWFEAADFADPLVGMGFERDTADKIVGGAGYAGMGVAALLAARKGKNWLGKGTPPTGGTGGAPMIGGKPVAELRKMAKSKFDTPGIARGKRDVLSKARRLNIGEGIDSLDNIPASQVQTLRNQIDDAVKAGTLTTNDRRILRGILTSLAKEGGDVSKAKIGAELIAEGPAGQSLFKKLKGGLKIGGVSLVGAAGAGYLGSEVLGGVGGLFVEEGSDKYARAGDVAGGAAGAVVGGAASARYGVPLLRLLNKGRKKHGTVGLAKLILRKGGPGLMARLGAKGLFAGGTSWTGLGAVVGLGLLIPDAWQVIKILQEEEDKGAI